jgi:hypothetical protein
MPQVTVGQHRTDSSPGLGALGPLSRAALVWAVVVALLLLLKGLPILRGSIMGRVALPIPEIAQPTKPPGDARALLFFRPMDLNAVSCEELTALPRIGYVTANRIIQFRRDLGFFLSSEELVSPEGPLSPSILGVIGPYVTAGGGDGPVSPTREDRSKEG